MQPPLQGCTIALSGSFPGYTQSSIEKDLILASGGSLCKTINESTTHLVTTSNDLAKPSAKVKQAKSQSHDVHIVTLAWLEDSKEQAAKLNEDDYRVDGQDALASNGTAARASRKRTLPIDATDDASDAESQQAVPKKKAKTGNASGSQTKSQDLKVKSAKPEPKTAKESKVKTEDGAGLTNIANSTAIHVPVDEYCGLSNSLIYINDEGVIYDANLNQTNSSNNNNKFYRIQLLRNGTDFKTWTRWGRVGERGQSAMLGSGSLGDAIHHFEKKFKDKSGLSWANRGDKAKSGKYTFIERSYEASDDEDTPTDIKAEEKEESPTSELDPAIQGLMELIFNQQYFAATMTELNYDVEKLPLGKLSKNTITRGYQALKDISDLINDASLAESLYDATFQEAAEQLSNAYYSLIPHAFGRNRPPIITASDSLNKEVELLDSLSDMKDAANIMKKQPKDVERINALDRQFQGLGMEEMTPLIKGSTEFKELQEYLVNTRGETHGVNYQVTNIFRIERQGERERFEKSPFSGPPRDRRLLWHGSRATNFGGILSQGLRIAPPEAPPSGYMFGKGIYLADMSSKSANYCCSSISNGHALLLLCEAELGNPMQELTDASYEAGDHAKAKGMSSTWGMGTTGPSLWKDASSVNPELEGTKMPDTSVLPGRTNVIDAFLQYNEYITYDVAQVRLRYLFQVRM